jgi:hypothetical protein
MRKSFLVFLPLLVLCFCFTNTNKKTKQQNKLAFMGEHNTIKVWDGSEQQSKTIVDLPDEWRIHALAFKDEHTLEFAVAGPAYQYAVSKSTSDTLRCPCGSEDIEQLVEGVVSSDKYLQIEGYIDTVYALSLKTKKTRIYKTIRYESLNKKQVRIHTRNFDDSGKLSHTLDSSYVCEHVDLAARPYGCEESVFDRMHMYSQSETKNDTYFFTKNGSLYQMKNGVASVFLEYTKKFEYKFGKGFFHPTLNHDGTTMIVGYSDLGFYSDSHDSPANLLKIDVQSKNIDTLSKDNFQFPEYAPQGPLCAMVLIKHKASEVFVYNTSNRKFLSLGTGHSPVWLGSRHRYY